MQNTIKIGFIGAGNMARSLIGGLVKSGANAAQISSYDPDQSRLASTKQDFGIHSAKSNQELLDSCDVLVLAIKPQLMHKVISELSLASSRQPLIITIAAGISTDAIQRWFTAPLPIVRAMPNTPALVQSGATGLFANENTSQEQQELAESILRSVGLTLWVEEEALLAAVTALSGSGPAYFFYVMEAMEEAAQELGLSAEAARLLTVQTAFGAAKLALEIEEEPQELRRRVTSPGGTTERALETLTDGGLKSLFTKALTAARDRATELSTELEKQ